MKKKQMKQKIENLKLAVTDQADRIDFLNREIESWADMVRETKIRAFDLLAERG